MADTRKAPAIPDSMEDWVKAQISIGCYASNREYCRDLISRDHLHLDQKVGRDEFHARHRRACHSA